MTTVKAWLASAALVGGAGGGAVAGLATVDGGAQAVAAPRPVAATPDTANLQAQIDALLGEDRALKHALQRARHRLAWQVHAGERSLAALHRRIVAAQNELAQAQAARARAGALSVGSAPSAVTAPAPHATTGASGAASGGESEHEGGGDD